MPTMTFKISADMAGRLDRMAARWRTTKSAVIREALEDKLRAAAGEPSVFAVMKGTVGSLDSGTRDLGHNAARLTGFGL
jgi:hypothetical protein